MVKFIFRTVENHNIVKVDFLTDNAMLQHAVKQAQAKTPHTRRYNPSARRRSEQEVFNDQLLGTIADIACCELLQTYFNAHQARYLLVERYDDIRSDNFVSPDLYDAKVVVEGKNQSIAEMEIRSSVCNKVSVELMLKIWHVLGWYITSNKSKEQIRDFYIRPIYHFNKYRGKLIYNSADAEKYLLNGELDLYIVGGATAQILENKGRIDQGNGLLQQGATYQLVPIMDALDIQQFLDTVLNFCVSKLNH